jgi:hypothetical protein
LPHEAVERLLNRAGYFVNTQRERNMTTPYDDLRIKFITEYDRSNPITAHKAMAEYFRFISGMRG